MHLMALCNPSLLSRRTLTKTMKITAIILLTACLQVAAGTNAQTVTLSLKNAPLQKVFTEAIRQTGVSIVYNETLLEGSIPVTIRMKNASIREVFDKCLEGQPFYYTMEGNTVVIKKRYLPEIVLPPTEVPVANPVTGVVLGPEGQPLPGVSITVKGTSKGATTDAQGKYTILLSEKDKILVFSFIGMTKQEVAIGDRKVINVVMEKDASKQEEVVVIGYGEQRREKVVGAIASITAKELNDMPASSFQDLLQGKIPGVIINTWSGEPGVRSEAYIRGVGVVGNDRNISPLYVIDGIPIEPMEDRTMLNRSTNTDPLAGLNPNDIESIDVLKDASAAAIYGSRGANGVIIVKTKKGIKNRPVVSYTTNLSMSLVPKLQETVGGAKERALKLKLWKDQVNFPEMDMMLTDSLNPFYNNSTDWQKLYYDNAFSSEHNVSISGGAEGVTYRLSLGTRSENGIMIGSDFKRHSISSVTKFTPAKNFIIDFGMQMSRTDRSRPNGNNNALTSNVGIGTNYPSSLIPGANSKAMKTLSDAYALMNGVNIDDNIRPSVGLNLTVLKNIRLNTRFSMDYRKYERSTFKPSALNGVDAVSGRLNGPSFNNSTGGSQTVLSENTISYLKSFKSGHTMDIVGGFSESFNESKNNYVNATKGVSDAVQDLNGYARENITTSSRYAANGLRSFFARAQYDYESKYIASFSARADGSSRFGKNYKWGYFPSAAFAWNLHREEFLKNVKWIDQLKLRWSWGVNGNQFGNDFLAQGVYSTAGLGSFDGASVNTYGGQPIVTPSYIDGLANPDLTWEESEQFNFGVDYSMFNYRVSLTLDAYWKKTSGILFDFKLPDISGYQTIFKNATGVINYGYEVGIKANITPPAAKFNWLMNLNGGLNRNVVSSLPNGNADILKRGTNGDQLIRVGRPANGYFVYMVDGVYANSDDVFVNPYTGARVYWGANFQAGDYIVGDLDGNGRIYEVNAQTGALMTSDRTFFGNNFPIVSGGISNTFRYNQWSLNLNCTYSIGRDVVNATLATKMRQLLQSPTGNMYDYTQYNHWQQPGDNATYPVLSPDRYKEMAAMYNVTNLSTYMEDASFLKLSNVRLGYTIDREKLKRYKIRNVSVFVQAINVFSITRYSGADPENVSMFGIDDGRNYARPRVFNLGFNFEF